MFLLVLAYPGCPGSKAIKRSLLLLLVAKLYISYHCSVIYLTIAHNTPLLLFGNFVKNSG